MLIGPKNINPPNSHAGAGIGLNDKRDVASSSLARAQHDRKRFSYLLSNGGGTKGSLNLLVHQTIMMTAQQHWCLIDYKG